MRRQSLDAGSERGSSRSAGAHRALVALSLLALLVGCGRTSTPENQATLSAASPVAAVSPEPTRTFTRQPTGTPVPTITPPPLTAPAIVEVLDLGGPTLPGHNPAGLALAGERIYVANEGSQTLSIIQDGAVRHALALGQGPYRLTQDALSGRTFVAAEASKSIYVLERDEIVDVWPVTLAPTALTVGGGALWVGGADGAIARLDLATGRLLSADAPLDDGMVVDLMALASGRVVSATYTQVHLYESADSGIIASRPYAVYRAAAIAGDTIYICAYDRVTDLTFVEELDGIDLTPLRRVTVADDVAAIAVDATRSRLYTAGTITNRVERLDIDDGSVVASVAAGLSPRALVLDLAGDHVYVTYSESDSMGVFTGQSLNRLKTVPVALRVAALAPAEGGRDVYVGLNTGELHLLTADGDRRLIGGLGYPVELLPLTDGTGLAVMDLASRQASLFDTSGHVVVAVSTAEGSGGLYLDTTTDRLYAGDAVLSPESAITDSVRITVGESEYPPVQMLRDTRRNVLYAVAPNGTPGSNGGLVVYRQDVSGWSGENVPGRLSVRDMVYDEPSDRFYTLCGHMGEFGVQVYDPATRQEVAYLRLELPPTAMLLSSSLHHLWVATGASAENSEGVYALLTAYDTRDWSPVATVRVAESLSSGAIDPSSGRLYLATAENALIYVLQDVALPGPEARLAPVASHTAGPTPETNATPTVTVAPSASATARPTATPTATGVPECAIPVQADLQIAWLSGGRFGCPTHPAMRETWGWQPFQSGTAYWRRDTRQVIIALSDGVMLPFEDRWQEGMPDQPCEATAPDGLWQPIRGFGLVWCQQPCLRERLGWATLPEATFLSTFQLFAAGVLFTDQDRGVIWLDNRGIWEQMLP